VVIAAVLTLLPVFGLGLQKNGADRSGLAAAIYDYAIAFRPADETTGQLSIRYGHFPFLWSGSWAMDRSFKRFLIEHEERRD
jgi:hypothetical protein